MSGIRTTPSAILVRLSQPLNNTGQPGGVAVGVKVMVNVGVKVRELVGVLVGVYVGSVPVAVGVAVGVMVGVDVEVPVAVGVKVIKDWLNVISYIVPERPGKLSEKPEEVKLGGGETL